MSCYKDQTVDLPCYYGLLYFVYYSSETNFHFIRFFKLPACVQEIIFTSDCLSFYKVYLIFSVSFSFENCGITSKHWEQTYPDKFGIPKFFHVFSYKMTLKSYKKRAIPIKTIKFLVNKNVPFTRWLKRWVLMGHKNCQKIRFSTDDFCWFQLPFSTASKIKCRAAKGHRYYLSWFPFYNLFFFWELPFIRNSL